MKDNLLLEVKNISKTFPGTKALNNVNLKVNKGEVHALVGENGAGKSTLMNIISGVLKPDKGGEIIYKGKKINLNNPKEANEIGIGIVHQELALCEQITVAENIYMDRFPYKYSKIIDYKNLYDKTNKILEFFPNNNINPKNRIAELNLAEKQIVEISKALSLDCELLILDEPTSSLTEKEAENLYNIINNLKEKGISILYISHRMSEIFDLCDTLTVLRDGNYIDHLKVNETNVDEVINKMVGREISNLYPEKGKNITENVLLKVKKMNNYLLKNINLELFEGEILGLSGLVGAGRTELARAICGIDEYKNGEVFLNNKKVQFNNYREAINNQLCYLTENRKEDGLFLNMNITNNIIAAKISDFGLMLSKNESIKISNNYVNMLNIKTSSLTQETAGLSGGNQQKVLFAKWLAINPKVIILDEPTRGIDVGAKNEIHNILRNLAEEGIGIIVISSELPEIIGLCDRVVVMHEGEITGVVKDDDITEKNIMKYASGQIIN